MKNLKVKFENSHLLHSYSSYSEVFQDIFVLQCLNGRKKGTFLEIGAGDPIRGNNTFLLHKSFDWDGVSIDYGYDDWSDDVIVTCDDKKFYRDDFKKYWTEIWHKSRNNKLILTDAISCNWKDIIDKNFNSSEIDYLQLDIDPAEQTYKCMLKLPFDSVCFKIITFEHDAYVAGNEWRQKSRKFLESKGYILIAGNISKDEKSPFEDWWIHLKYINEINPLIIRNTFEDVLPVKEYLFHT